MLYIIEEEFSDAVTLSSAWDVDCNDVKSHYNNFMLGKAAEENIVVNPQWILLNRLVENNWNLKLYLYEF